MFWVTLGVYIILQLSILIYAKQDADSDYIRIKKHGGILDHSDDVIERTLVFMGPNIVLFFFVQHWIFFLAFNMLALGIYSNVFEALMNKHLGENFLYTGRTSDFDKFFHRLPNGDIIKVILKLLIFAIGLWLSFVVFVNYNIWMI